MAISKLILNGEVQMDVTSDTVTAGSMLSGTTATKNDGTKITGEYPDVPVFSLYWDGTTWDSTISCNKTYSECLALYNNSSPLKACTLKEYIDGQFQVLYGGSVFLDDTTLVYTSFDEGAEAHCEVRYNSNNTLEFIQPASVITSGYFTAPGYYYAGTHKAFNAVDIDIPTKTSSNLTVSGATVTAPAGYYANAASKAVTTTTHPNPTASIASSTGVVTASHTQGTGYVTGGTTTGTLNLTTQAGKTVTPTESAQTAVASYRWTTGNITVAAISSTYVGTGVTTRSAANLTANGSVVTVPAGYYSTAATKSVAAGSAFPPAVTITKAPTIGVNTSGVVTASYNGSSSITPTVTSGYVSKGTAGTISTTGTSTYQLTSKTAATYYPSTADQTIASQRWLVGNQTIKSVTTSNLTAANIAEGVVVKVGDSASASRITQVTGTYQGGLTCTITGNGNYYSAWIEHNNKTYYGNTSFVFQPGDAIAICKYADELDFMLNVDGKEVCFVNSGQQIDMGYYLPSNNVTINFSDEFSSQAAFIEITNEKVYIATIKDSGNSNYCYVTYNNNKWHAAYQGNISFQPGNTLTIRSSGNITINGVVVTKTNNIYNYTLPASDILIDFNYTSETNNSIIITGKVDPPSGTYNITTNGTYDVANYANAKVSVQGSGFTVSQIAMRSISGSISANVSTIGYYAFAACSSLYSAIFSTCQTISDYAFYSCTSLSNISFPACTTIGSYAFVNCFKLTAASFPLCLSIGEYAFKYCWTLSKLNFPSCKTIGAEAFSNCSALTTASFPACETIAFNAFYRLSRLSVISFPVCSFISASVFAYCSSLTTASFPACTTIGNSAFNNCTKLTTVSFPICTTISISAFYSCTQLTTVSFPACTTIGSSAFVYCYNLLSVYLLGSSVVNLKGSVFYSTPIAGYTTSTGGVYGSIFVPASLYNSYLTATNWSSISARIVSV